MIINISLSDFIEQLKLAQEFDCKYPNLDQTNWLLTQWSFDDSKAYYGQKPDIYAVARAWLEILKTSKQ